MVFLPLELQKECYLDVEQSTISHDFLSLNFFSIALVRNEQGASEKLCSLIVTCGEIYFVSFTNICLLYVTWLRLRLEAIFTLVSSRWCFIILRQFRLVPIFLKIFLRRASLLTTYIEISTYTKQTIYFHGICFISLLNEMSQ